MRATPDLGLPLTLASAARAYVCEGDPEAFVLLPDGLTLARAPASEGGGLDFSLQYVRRAVRDASARADYGVLAFRLAARYLAATEALAAARRFAPAAALRFAHFNHGFLRFRPLGATEPGVPTALLRPRALRRNGLGFWFRSVLDAEATACVAQGIATGMPALRGYAELTFSARAVRVPVRVAFDAAALRETLGLDERRNLCTRAELTDVLRLVLARGGLFACEGECAPELLAEVLTDWVVARFGTLVPAPTLDRQMHVRLELARDESASSPRWDLASPLLATRLEVLDVDPLDEARALGPDFAPEQVRSEPRAQGVASLRPCVLVPPGLTAVVGVDVHAPASATRPTALSASVAFEPPAYRPSCETPLPLALPCSQREPRRCTLTPFVVVDGVKCEGRGREVALAPDALDDDVMMVELADLPVRWATLEASAPLLRLADVHVTVSCRGAARVPEPFTLTAATPAHTVILPLEAHDAQVLVRARAHGSARVVEAGPFSLAGPCWIDLHSFAAFGHHEVALSWEFGDGEHVANVELAVCDEGEERVRVVQLDRLRPTARIQWVTASPFDRGLRVRRRRPERWREVPPTCTHVVLSRATFG